MKQQPDEMERPIANFHPDHWGDRFLNYIAPDEVTQKHKEEEAKELKELVRKQLVDVIKDPKEKLEYVDAILRLGVAYHFEKEIEDNLQKFHNNNLHCDDSYKDDLHYVSLRFRILRQHGFYESSDIFEKFKCETGKFKNCLAKDVQGVLSLYEASYLRVHGETILDEALAFATTCLRSSATQLSSPMAEKIVHSLETPLHRRSIRLESLYQMTFYESNPSHCRTLLKFAKLYFNLLQVLHNVELRDLTRWWKSFVKKIKVPKFSRDRIVEIYYWSLGTYYEPQYTYARMCLSKLLKIISIIDDIYDAYGTIEELVVLTEAIQRWDDTCRDQLPEYMRLFYQATLDTFEGFEQDLARKERSYSIHYLREQLKATCQSYLQEAKWCRDKFVPTYDEYLEHGVISTGYLYTFVASFMGMGEIANQDTFKWFDKNSKAPRASCILLRLSNDIAGHKFEKNRGHVVSAVECYMEQFNTSEEEAYKEIKGHMEEEWKKINQAMLRPTEVPRPLLTRVLNLSRILYDFYKIGEDGYTISKYSRPKVEAVLIDSVII